MNRYDFTQPGGFPFDQGVMKFIQDSITLAAQTATLAGPLAILSGCVVAGGSVGDGIVVINGEILPFTGGLIEDKVVINEVATTVVFQDDAARVVKYVRTATFGDDGGATDYLWANFQRNTPEGVLSRITALEGKQYFLSGDIKEIDCTEDYMLANFDDTGLGINERLGWAISNGQNGTRDRRGKTSVQLDITQVEFAGLGQTVGEKAHVLLRAELPAEGLNVNGLTVNASYHTGGNSQHAAANDPAAPPAKTENMGDGVAHNNIQPSIVTLIIQKL